MRRRNVDFEIDVLYLLAEKGLTKGQAAAYIISHNEKERSKNSVMVRISILVNKKYLPKGILAKDHSSYRGAQTYHKGAYYEAYMEDLLHERKIKEGILGVSHSIEELPEKPTGLLTPPSNVSDLAKMDALSYHKIEFYVTLRKRGKMLVFPKQIKWGEMIHNRQNRKRQRVGEYLYPAINPRDPIKFQMMEKKDGAWSLQIWLPVIYIKKEWLSELKDFFFRETFQLVNSLFNRHWLGVKDLQHSDFRQNTKRHCAWPVPIVETLGMNSGEVRLIRDVWIDFSRGYAEIETDNEERLDVVDQLRKNMDILTMHDFGELLGRLSSIEKRVLQHEEHIAILAEATKQLQERIVPDRSAPKHETGPGGMFQ